MMPSSRERVVETDLNVHDARGSDGQSDARVIATAGNVIIRQAIPDALGVLHNRAKGAGAASVSGAD